MRLFFYLFLFNVSVSVLSVSAQSRRITGVVTDENRLPLPFVNLYIEGTIEGTTSGDDGGFELITEQKGELMLMASFVGYITGSVRISTDTLNPAPLNIQLLPRLQAVREVVAYAGNYLLKSASTLEQKGAVDLIATAGSEGDLFKAISLMPGTQAPGLDGRMMVRGGDSRESQTYIDGMHLLSPYTTTAQHTPARSRFSAFLFDGITFSTGGYSQEYTQSLSSILPLTTSDESRQSKLGVKLMNVGSGGGGTKAWNNGSLSFNFDYTDLQWYHATTNPQQRIYWKKPYREYAGQSLLRFQLRKDTYWKTFLSYAGTRFTHYEEKPFSQLRREMGYDETNLYLNSTFKTRLASGVNFFGGLAYSLNGRTAEEAVVPDDRLLVRQRELHLKVKAAKRFSSFYKLETGVESYDRGYGMQYRDSFVFEKDIRHRIGGLFVSNDFHLTDRLFLNLSSRLEYISSDRSYTWLPRMALNYEWKGLTVSAVAGKYQQMTDNDYLLYNPSLSAETNRQYLLGLYFRDKNRIYRAEAYHKAYDKLPALRNGHYQASGSGYSRGIDLFVNERRLLKHWEYTVSYSYNDSRRQYLDYPEQAVPSFVSRHNASLSLRYENMRWLSIIGLTQRFASGRPYHDPNREGFMNALTPAYHTIDVSWILLAHKNLIVYACFSNLLNRRNVFGYDFTPLPDSQGFYDSLPQRQEQPQAFYIGFFLTLGKNVAYEASNF
ncbi:MAG: TonB-dependent receptor [Tannerellaceae bacterium]|jgi:hypothetical protein|nr:TonB-dependent receptor [Tannerellaceae bacterium]